MTLKTMRRSSTVRTRPSSSYISNETKIYEEKELEEPAEDGFRRQIIALEIENNKLKLQIDSLKDQLNQRPPLEKIQEMEKEYKSLDLIMLGTQRENMRCMAELDRAKDRVRILEDHLEKLAGANWQTALGISSSSSLRSAGMPSARSSLDSNLRSSEPSHGAEELNTGFESKPLDEPAPDPYKKNEELRAFLTSIRTMMLGLDDQMQKREVELTGVIERAEKESEKYEALRAEMEEI